MTISAASACFIHIKIGNENAHRLNLIKSTCVRNAEQRRRNDATMMMMMTLISVPAPKLCNAHRGRRPHAQIVALPYEAMGPAMRSFSINRRYICKGDDATDARLQRQTDELGRRRETKTTTFLSLKRNAYEANARIGRNLIPDSRRLHG